MALFTCCPAQLSLPGDKPGFVGTLRPWPGMWILPGPSRRMRSEGRSRCGDVSTWVLWKFECRNPGLGTAGPAGHLPDGPSRLGVGKLVVYGQRYREYMGRKEPSDHISFILLSLAQNPGLFLPRVFLSFLSLASIHAPTFPSCVSVLQEQIASLFRGDCVVTASRWAWELRAQMRSAPPLFFLAISALCMDKYIM